MTQKQLDDAVAKATGESLLTIQHHGFSLADPIDVCFDPESYDGPPNVVDWDALEAERFARF